MDRQSAPTSTTWASRGTMRKSSAPQRSRPLLEVHETRAALRSHYVLGPIRNKSSIWDPARGSGGAQPHITDSAVGLWFWSRLHSHFRYGSRRIVISRVAEEVVSNSREKHIIEFIEGVPLALCIVFGIFRNT